MSIGAGIFMIVVGAVLAFAIDPNLGGGVANLDLIGYILIGAGVLVTIIGTAFMFKKRKTTTAVSSSVDNATGERIDRRETISSNPQTPLT